MGTRFLLEIGQRSLFIFIIDFSQEILFVLFCGIGIRRLHHFYVGSVRYRFQYLWLCNMRNRCCNLRLCLYLRRTIRLLDNWLRLYFSCDLNNLFVSHISKVIQCSINKHSEMFEHSLKYLSLIFAMHKHKKIINLFLHASKINPKYIFLISQYFVTNKCFFTLILCPLNLKVFLRRNNEDSFIIFVKIISINFIQRNMEQLQKGHILKFVAKGKTFNTNVGIRTFPRQTYGVSDQSPKQFHQTYTLTGEHGYIYQHQSKPEFQYPSQQHFFDVHRCEELATPTQSHHLSLKNPVAFHRKKGRLSQFMDKNGWMSPVIPIMGFQRTENARALSNKDRQNKINSLKPKVIYDNPAAKKSTISPEHYKTISVVMGQKLRIRKKRQELLSRQGPLTARPIVELYNDPLQIENVEDKMNKTNMQFYSTCSTFFARNGTAQGARNSISRQLSQKLQGRLTGRLERAKSERKKDPKLKYRVISPLKQTRLSSRKAKEVTPNPLQNDDLKLQEWYRSTCNNKWTYNPKKLDSEEQQEANRLLISTNF